MASQSSPTRELMRYVKVRAVPVIDLQTRVAQSRALSVIAAKPKKERTAWARAFLSSKEAALNFEQLRYPYRKYLTIKESEISHSPSSRSLAKDVKDFGAAMRADAAYASDLERCLSTVYALVLLDRLEDARGASRVFAFVDAMPDTPGRIEEQPLPTLMTSRYEPKAIRTTKAAEPKKQDRPSLDDDLKDQLTSLDLLWRARTKIVAKARSEAVASMSKVGSSPLRTSTSGKNPKGRTPPSRTASAAARRRAEHAELARLRREAMVATIKYRDLRNTADLVYLASLDAGDLASRVGWPVAQVRKAQAVVSAMLAEKPWSGGKFCRAYEETATNVDVLPIPKADPGDGSCFAENPSVSFGDSVRLLGVADLIRVDETLIEYVPGEISYIENILAGEVRKREVRDTKYFEQTTEVTTQSDKQRSSETSATTKQDLRSQVESELSTRLATEMNASAQGSGGGTIGVVDFEGAASFGSSASLGVDTKLSSSTTSTFSQEIVSKAIEAVKTTTIERRLSRTYSLYETLNSHKIDNASGANPANRKGVYCFLDKHVCISESTYGRRLFITATLRAPGRNLLCARLREMALARGEAGVRPEFNISVDHVTPGTYKELTAKFKAQNVEPPPAPLITLSKVYKMDRPTPDAKPGFDPKKVAEFMAPLFERYQHCLITDNVQIPEGYEVREATVTVNHGSCGLSIPAHLPLTIPAAALGSAMTLSLMAASPLTWFTCPLAGLQFLHAASPVLHYNTDSSHVTICLGNEAAESSYFFFAPDRLVREVFAMLGTFLDNAPNLLQVLKNAGDTLVAALAANAQELADGLKEAIETAVNDLHSLVQSAISAISVDFKNLTISLPTLGQITSGIVNAIKALHKTAGGLFKPVETFLNAVIGAIEAGIQNAMVDLFSELATMFESSDTITLTPSGLRGELPVSINVAAINPGVTINLVACLQRTPEALDRWKLDTFEKLYQGFVQLVAEHDARQSLGATSGLTRNPSSLREEERAAVKELVLHSMNNLHAPHGAIYSQDAMHFFESALDWKNMVYRAYRYGPSMTEVDRDHDGIFNGADDRRRDLLSAAWAQVMLPVVPDPRLEGKVIKYFDDGSMDLEGGFTKDELTALYQDLVLGRDASAQGVTPVPVRKAYIPTDLIELRDDLPPKRQTPCQ
ncbi:MAG: hypothetical protein IT363_08410 [Methanoregulaceae archaeon]|nr:hypothetical protein [Methanoregulaceae archaeon]